MLPARIRTIARAIGLSSLLVRQNEFPSAEGPLGLPILHFDQEGGQGDQQTENGQEDSPRFEAAHGRLDNAGNPDNAAETHVNTISAKRSRQLASASLIGGSNENADEATLGPCNGSEFSTVSASYQPGTPIAIGYGRELSTPTAL